MRNPANKCCGGKWGEAEKAALYHPPRPWAFKNATVISNPGPDDLEEIHRKESSPERLAFEELERFSSWMNEGRSFRIYSKSHKKERYGKKNGNEGEGL